MLLGDSSHHAGAAAGLWCAFARSCAQHRVHPHPSAPPAGFLGPQRWEGGPTAHRPAGNFTPESLRCCWSCSQEDPAWKRPRLALQPAAAGQSALVWPHPCHGRGTTDPTPQAEVWGPTCLCPTLGVCIAGAWPGGLQLSLGSSAPGFPSEFIVSSSISPETCREDIESAGEPPRPLLRAGRSAMFSALGAESLHGLR